MQASPLSRSASIGSFTMLETSELGLLFKATSGNLRLQTFGPNMVRVTLSRSQAFDDFSYAVIAAPSPIDAACEETGEFCYLKTPSLTVSISKRQGALRFLTPEGRTINEDDEGLATSWIGEQATTYKKLQAGERFVGLGEKTGPLDRRGSAYTNWNSDAYAYNSGTDPLYSSIPFYIGIHNGLVYGIFLDNTHRSVFNFGAANNRFSSFAIDGGDMDYYFIYGASVAEIIHHYTHLTGRIKLPPLWSIGYQQCRYSYYPDKEVLNAAHTFREKDIPADVIVLDIHYMHRYKIFTWDPNHFPDPKSMIDQLREMGFHVVVICDPGIKIEDGYAAFEDGRQQDVFLKYPDGEPYAGQVWPGWCHFPDFTRPDTRTWWANQLKAYADLGIEGFWNDMNEIATWGHALPDNVVFDFEGRKGTMRNGRNIYGFQMARATYEGARHLLNNRRPFNLTRSGFAGVQRFAAVWTGDNVSYDEHMILGVRMLNCMGLSGVAFAGYDVGGFVGEANASLYGRWISLGAFSPFFRSHTMINTRDSEPWSYGEKVEQIARNYIKFRYQLMPYLYSLFAEAAETGMPVQRSLVISYPHDEWVYNGLYQNQYLFGPFILVAPVESTQSLAKIFLPTGTWYSVYDGAAYEGNREIILDCPLHKLPVFIQAGAIIPMQPTRQHTGESNDLLIVHIYHGSPGSSFELYLDDGTTFEYEKGSYLKRQLSYLYDTSSIVMDRSEGPFVPSFKKIRMVLHGFSHVHQGTINGQTYELQRSVHSYFSPLEKYDPIKDPDPIGEEEVLMFELDYLAERFEVFLS